MSGGPVGARWELGQAEELRQHPLPLVPERVIDGVIQTDGFHQAHRQRAMIFPFRRHIFRPSVSYCKTVPFTRFNLILGLIEVIDIDFRHVQRQVVGERVDDP